MKKYKLLIILFCVLGTLIACGKKNEAMSTEEVEEFLVEHVISEYSVIFNVDSYSIVSTYDTDSNIIYSQIDLQLHNKAESFNDIYYVQGMFEALGYKNINFTTCTKDVFKKTIMRYVDTEIQAEQLAEYVYEVFERERVNLGVSKSETLSFKTTFDTDNNPLIFIEKNGVYVEYVPSDFTMLDLYKQGYEQMKNWLNETKTEEDISLTPSEDSFDKPKMNIGMVRDTDVTGQYSMQWISNSDLTEIYVNNEDGTLDIKYDGDLLLQDVELQFDLYISYNQYYLFCDAYTDFDSNEVKLLYYCNNSELYEYFAIITISLEDKLAQSIDTLALSNQYSYVLGLKACDPTYKTVFSDDYIIYHNERGSYQINLATGERTSYTVESNEEKINENYMQTQEYVVYKSLEDVLREHADAIVFKNNSIYEKEIDTVIYVPSTNEIFSFSDESNEYYGYYYTELSSSDDTVMYEDVGSITKQYDIYYGDESLVNDVIIDFLVEDEIYKQFRDIYTDFESDEVKVIYYYCNYTTIEEFVIVTIPIDEPLKQSVEHIPLENGEYDDYSHFMELVMSQNIIFFEGFPEMCSLDIATGKICTWKDMRAPLRHYAKGEHMEIVADVHPIAYNSGYLLVGSSLGIQEISTPIYAIYTEDGTFMNFVINPGF